MSFGPEQVTDDLALDADLRFEVFPARGARLPDVLGGISGELSIAGRLTEKAAVSHVITPGVSTVGAGTIAADLVLKKGIVRAGSEYSLQSDAFHLWVMGLDASGSATVSGKTVKERGKHVSRMQVDLGDFQFVDPEDGSVELESGDITFGRPMAVDGSVKIGMYDSRPVIALLKRLDIGPGWLSMAPSIKGVDGTLDVSLSNGHLAFDDLAMTGEGFQALGWVNVKDKKADGRLFVRFKSVMAGVALDQSKAKIHLSKPRMWFDEQPTGPRSSPAGEVPAAE